MCLALPDYPVPDRESYAVRDLLTDRVYPWTGAWNFVRLDPDLPAHIFDVTRPAFAKATAGRPAIAEATGGRPAIAEATSGRPAIAEAAAAGRPATANATADEPATVTATADKLAGATSVAGR